MSWFKKKSVGDSEPSVQELNSPCCLCGEDLQGPGAILLGPPISHTISSDGRFNTCSKRDFCPGCYEVLLDCITLEAINYQ